MRPARAVDRSLCNYIIIIVNPQIYTQVEAASPRERGKVRGRWWYTVEVMMRVVTTNVMIKLSNKGGAFHPMLRYVRLHLTGHPVPNLPAAVM